MGKVFVLTFTDSEGTQTWVFQSLVKAVSVYDELVSEQLELYKSRKENIVIHNGNAYFESYNVLTNKYTYIKIEKKNVE